MNLSEKDIRHIAELARLELTDTEVKKYRTELGGILRYVDELKKVNIKNVEPTARLSAEENRLRPDGVEDWDTAEREAALAQVPSRLKGQVKVRRILS